MALSPDSQTDPYARDSSADVNAILQGMTDATIDRQQARRDQALPAQVQPNYRAPLPVQLAQNAPQLPPEVQPNQPNYTVTGTGPGTWWRQQQQQQPPIPPQFQQNQPPVPLQPPSGQPPPQQQSSLDTSLIRDPTGRNNPGNIRIPGGYGPMGFQRFPTMQDGIRALQNNLLAYQDRHGLNTIRGIISRWSPPNENDTERAISQAEQVVGVDRNQRLDLHDRATMTRMTNAILFNEQRGSRGSGQGLNEFRDQYQAPGGMNLPQPQQNYAPAQPRSFAEWGRTPVGMGGTRPGEMPRHSDFGRIMGAIAPLMVGLVSLAARMPLSTAITAYGAMARAQQNGQQLDYERNRTRFQDQLKEHNAQQALESQEAGDAFSEYGNNNPQGLQQQLASIALKYNDPAMFRMAQNGDLNGIHQLQQRRDMGHQDLSKLEKANQEHQDRQAQDAAVGAMDRQWHDQFVKDNGREPTADESAIAHNEHIGQAGRAGTKDPRTGTGGTEGMQPYDVVDKDTGEVTRQVRLGKDGKAYDLNGQPTTIDTAKEKLERPATPRSAGGRDMTEGDYTWTNPDGSQGEGYAKVKGKQLVDAVTEEPIPTKPGTRVNKISAQSASQAGNAARGKTGPIEDWEGMNEGQPPPGVSQADWAQAQDWARLGRAPPGLSSRSGAYQGAHDALPYALHAIGKTGASMPRDAIDYETQKTAATATERYFASGMGARQLTSLDTVAAHIQLFREYGAAVKSGDIQAINKAAGNLATATGSPELIDMGIAATITGDEVIRLLTQTGGSRGDREDIKDRLSIYSSPEQFEGIANTLTNFVRERYEPLRQQYTNRLGATPEQKAQYEEAFKNKITPAARAIIENKQPIAGQDRQPGQGQSQQPAWADPQGKPAYLNGRTIWHKPDGKWYFEDQSLVPGQ